ncbi:MAG: FAD-binding protein [Phycisphaerales bacterium]|jgi:glycolate oxidase|nr:FAD-binding protein [Phycisphaerales bacterium]
MIAAQLQAELAGILPAGDLMVDPSELFVYEFDGFTIARARPGAVVFPTSTEQVVQIVKLLAAAGVQIVPRGTGTGLAGGCVAFENGVIVSTSKMNRIHSIDLRNRVADVEAGVRNTALSDAVAQLPGGSAYHFAPDPSSQRASTIGGNAATNAGGIHTLKDFVSSNHVLGMEMVLADGTILRTGAAAGCYESPAMDLPGLICGSEGTFGIITRLQVRLVPKAQGFRTIVATFGRTADACHTVSKIIADGHLPCAMEMLDGSMVRVIEDAFHFGFVENTQALVLIEVDGIEELLDGQMKQIVAICSFNNATSLETSADPTRRAALWKARKSAFGAIGRISHSYCTQDACVPRSMLASVLEKIDQIGREYGLQITNVFHAGDGNVHPIFLYDDRDENEVQNTLRAAEKVLQYCIDVGGTVTGEHGVGIEKLHLMNYQFDRPTMDQFQRTKRAFDPDERINAGKLLPSEVVKVQILKPGRHMPQ